jgi:hypothetical protein
MKITKKQLKRIIREEKAKLLREASRHASPTAQMWAKQSGQDLYVNLTDEQQLALDDLERAVDKCIAAGVTDADITDTIESRTMS